MVQLRLQSYIQTPTRCLNKNARIFCCCNVSALDRHQANNLPKQRGHLKQEVAANLQSIPVITWNQQQTSAAPSEQANNNKFISNILRLIFLGINRWALPYLLSINLTDSHEILTWTCPELIRSGAAINGHMPVSLLDVVSASTSEHLLLSSVFTIVPKRWFSITAVYFPLLLHPSPS